MQALSQLSYTPECFRIESVRCPSLKTLAEWTGLEPATPGVTGRYSNQLNYHSRYSRSFDPSHQTLLYLFGNNSINCLIASLRRCRYYT